MRLFYAEAAVLVTRGVDDGARGGGNRSPTVRGRHTNMIDVGDGVAFGVTVMRKHTVSKIL